MEGVGQAYGGRERGGGVEGSAKSARTGGVLLMMMPSQHSCSSCLHSPTEVLLIPASCVGCVQLGPCLLQVPVPADQVQQQRREACRGRRAPADGQSGKGEEREKGQGGRTISHK